MKTYVVKNNNIYILPMRATYYLGVCSIFHCGLWNSIVHMYTHTCVRNSTVWKCKQVHPKQRGEAVTVYMFVVHGTALPQRVVGTRVIDNNNKKHGIKITRSQILCECMMAILAVFTSVTKNSGGSRRGSLGSMKPLLWRAAFENTMRKCTM